MPCITGYSQIGGAMDAAKHARAGFWGYGTALFLSIVLGIAFGSAVRASVARLFHAVGGQPKTALVWLYLAIYLCAAFLWPFLGLFVGEWASKPVLSLLH
jgi:hypothetical protein